MSLSSPFICFEINRGNFFKHISCPVVNRLASFRASFYFRSCLRSDNGQVKFASTQKPLPWWVGEVMVSNFVFCTRRLSSCHQVLLKFGFNRFGRVSGKKGKQNTTLAACGKGQAHQPHGLYYWVVSECDFVLRETFRSLLNMPATSRLAPNLSPTTPLFKVHRFRLSSLERTFLPRICMDIKASRREISLMRNCFLCSLPSGGLNFLQDKRKVFWLA